VIWLCWGLAREFHPQRRQVIANVRRHDHNQCEEEEGATQRPRGAEDDCQNRKRQESYSYLHRQPRHKLQEVENHDEGGGSSQRRVGSYELRDCIATRIRPSGQRIDFKCIFSQFRYDYLVLSEVSGVGKKEG